MTVRVLDGFTGTGSIRKVCEQLGWECITVDIDKQFNPTHLCDMLEFDYKQYPKDYFDICTFSPPCTNYSKLKRCWFGRKLKDGKIYTREQNAIDQDEADKLVLKSLEIIDYFNPQLWWIENPQTGDLKNRDIMKGIPYYDADYCMYSLWGYKKRTRFWTNKKEWNNLLCNGHCPNMITIDTQEGDKHAGTKEPIKSKTRTLHKSPLGNPSKCKSVKQHMIHSINLGNADNHLRKKHSKNVSDFGGGSNRLERYRIPEDLIFSLFLD